MTWRNRSWTQHSWSLRVNPQYHTPMKRPEPLARVNFGPSLPCSVGNRELCPPTNTLYHKEETQPWQTEQDDPESSPLFPLKIWERISHLTDAYQLQHVCPYITAGFAVATQGTGDRLLPLSKQRNADTQNLGTGTEQLTAAGHNFSKSGAGSAPKGAGNSWGAHLWLRICGIEHLQRHVCIHCIVPCKPAPRGARPSPPCQLSQRV